MFLQQRFQDVKIGTKFNILLILVFILGIVLSGAILSTVLQQKAQNEISSQAKILFQVVNSVRNYTQDGVNPLLAPRLETEPAFIPEAIPTFSVREVFENFRQSEEYKNFFYKDAAPNPTNLRDKADEFETQLVEEFRRFPQKNEDSGFRNLPEGKVFYIARPFQVTREQCLQCHSTPAAAPKSLVATYGSEHGFNWKLNDIVAAQIIYIPAGDVFDSARRSFSVVMGVLIFIFAIVLMVINFLLKKAIIKRIRKIAHTAQQVSTGNMDADFTENSKDEIGALALAFNRMKSSLEISMKLIKHPRK